MKVSARTEYACIAILELAARYDSSNPSRVRDLAEAHNIPTRFLVQILLQMKASGFVVSTRGKSGGYQLNRPPQQITLAEVMSAIEGPKAIGGNNSKKESSVTLALREIWNKASHAQQEVLKSVTVAELLDQTHKPTGHMYYI
jgi:Rrf2 family protein